MSKELLSIVKKLEEKVRLLELENSDWTDRSEDIYLFATTSESISTLSEKHQIFEVVLEKISIIKDFPYCAFGSLNNKNFIIECEYASFSESEKVVNISITDDIYKRLSNNETIIENYLENRSNIFFNFNSSNFTPHSYIIIPFTNNSNKIEFLICVDNNSKERIELMQNTILHFVKIVNSRLDNIYLLERLSEQKDLLELKVEERTAELLKAKEVAEKSNRLKSDFLAQISHEIRTPVNTILNFTNLIESVVQDKLEPDLRDGFKIIYSASSRLTRTIDLILNVSEVQTDSYEYIPKKVDLYADVFEKLLKEFNQVANLRGIKLLLTKRTESTCIVADEYSIVQIFSNLIDNAIKFTKKGHVLMDISRNYNNKLIVEVSDTGIGISKNFLLQIFDSFSQETQGYSRSFEGNGLGLTLVKKYCELNNATIEVESEKGIATKFRVLF
jgi:signal transduction histidine kinase